MKNMNTEFDHIDAFEVKNCLIVPIQFDLYDDFIAELTKALLERIDKTSILGVIIDISSINIIDTINFKNIIQMCEMVRLMGKETIIMGMQPNVAGALTEFSELNLKKFLTFMNLETAITYLHKKRNQKKLARKTSFVERV